MAWSLVVFILVRLPNLYLWTTLKIIQKHFTLKLKLIHFSVKCSNIKQFTVGVKSMQRSGKAHIFLLSKNSEHQ